MATYHGKGLRVLISSSGTGTATPLAGVTEWSIDSSTDRAEVTAGGDSNKTYVQGFSDAQISFSGVWNDTESKLVAGAASSDGIKAYLYPAYATAAGKYVAGPFWLDVSFSASTGDAVKFTASLAANGAVTNNL